MIVKNFLVRITLWGNKLECFYVNTFTAEFHKAGEDTLMRPAMNGLYYDNASNDFTFNDISYNDFT
jgi:hypothetical protein